MPVLLTGAAGFIGSLLAERLLQDGHHVRAVDCFSDFYDPSLKRHNVTGLSAFGGFELVELDLATAALDSVVADVDTVIHLAGQPGVRTSWGGGIGDYVQRNVIATNRLLEACRDIDLGRFVYASSSSVYGEAERSPTSELALPAPTSPYGVTKLAAEHLVHLYAVNFGLPTVSLRYFSVYGPRQRPDMAVHRLIRSALHGRPFPMNGDGSQARDLTFVSDVVNATVAASCASTDRVTPGSVLNIGGGEVVTLASILVRIEEITGRPVPIERLPAAPGDPARTGADCERARRLLDWMPEVGVREGLERQVVWQRSLNHG